MIRKTGILFITLYSVTITFSQSILYNSDSTDMVVTAYEPKGEWIHRLIDSLHLQGHFEASLDSVYRDSLFHYAIHSGKVYQYVMLEKGKIPDNIDVDLEVPSTGYSLLQLRFFLKKQLLNLAQLGYAKAQIHLSESKIENHRITTKLNLDLGYKVMIDSVMWDQELKLPASYIHSLLGLREGEVFTDKKISDALIKVKGLIFLQSYSDPLIIIDRNKALIRFYLRSAKENHLDALLGLLPASGGSNKLKINGTFNAYLLNQFYRGESILLNFQSLQNNSQSLKIESSIPNPLRCPCTPSVQFNLYRRDSSFLDVRLDASIKANTRGQSKYSFNMGISSSSILSPDLNQILITKSLPAALDLTNRYLGLSLANSQYDANRFPHKGFSFYGFVNGITRSIKKNISITSLKDADHPDYNYESLYNAFPKSNYAVESGIDLTHILKTSRFTSLSTRLMGRWKASSGTLQLNELYRIGGNSTLRGFDEESIYCDRFAILSNEFRLWTGDASYLLAHVDAASVHQHANDHYVNQSYLSMGVGMVVNTSLGLLSLTTSAGNQLPNGFDLSRVKVHIGYINYF